MITSLRAFSFLGRILCWLLGTSVHKVGDVRQSTSLAFSSFFIKDALIANIGTDTFTFYKHAFVYFDALLPLCWLHVVSVRKRDLRDTLTPFSLLADSPEGE